MSAAQRKRRRKDKAYSPSPIAHGPKAAEAALVIFAKAPIPGQVKTRLCPPLTPDEAATLHGTFVLDVLERSGDAQRRAPVAFDRHLCCAPSADHVYFKILGARHGVGLDTQTGEDLGARMRRACEAFFARGYRRVLILGTDIPTLSPRLLNEAVAQLDDHDVVLGPAPDGGYYLIGLTRPVPELFRDIPWSTSDVLPVTQRIAAGLNLRVALLPPQRDIDRFDDLQALIEEAGLGARGSRQAAGHDGAPPLATHPLPRANRLSKRTAGVLHTLAERLRGRPTGGQ